MRVKDLIAEISDLPIDQRAKIADHILQTLNSPDPEIEAAWIQEVEERVDEYEKGNVEMIPAKKVFKSLREITKE